MMVERYPNLKEEVGSPIPICEISSLLNINLSGGQLPPVLLALATCLKYMYNLEVEEAKTLIIIEVH